MPERKGQELPPQDSVTGCLLRLSWMLFGSIAIVCAAVYIGLNTATLFSLADLVFWAVVAALVAIRYWDVARFHGLTAMGEPATMAHWRRYVAMLVGGSLAVWGLAHGIAYLSR